MAKTKPVGLRIRMLADRESTDRVTRFDPITGEQLLVDPADHNVDDRADAHNWVHKPWPLAGVVIDGDTPEHVRLPMSSADKWCAEGWAERENERIEVKPGGPPEDPMSRAHLHVFRQCDAVILHLQTGDVRYRVTHQPDKYDDPGEESGSRVDWFYDLELEG